jgi:hypothetical protein
MRITSVLLFLGLLLGMVAPAAAQFKDSEPGGARIEGKSQVSRWQIGMIIKASSGACKGIFGYAPVPAEWPEQDVQIIKEDVSPGVRIQYETVDGGVKLMTVNIANLLANTEAKALVTFEVRRTEVLPPNNTDVYVLPDPKKIPANVKRYLLPSPKIESRDAKIRELAKQIGADKAKAWERVEAIYDWVRGHTDYKSKNGAAIAAAQARKEPAIGALDVLRSGRGDCEGFTSLFVAICRAADIPARTVWVYGHVYPEFYLDDDKGQGHWFPCQSIGSKGSAREFGGVTQLDVIVQKGDNVRPPRGKERQRLMSEYATGKGAKGTQPQCRFVRQPAPKE